MYQYHCLNAISEVGLQRFTNQYQETKTIQEADALLVRSADLHTMEFDPQLKAIARAGAGVNNIPLDTCAKQGIVVFNTPGANANGVKELVLAGMFLAARDVVDGINWVRENEHESQIAKLTEKQKKAFAGTELDGKKLGVIGLGAIGVLVANAAVHLGMDVYGYDPYLSVDAAWKLSRNIHHATSVEELYQECDYLTIHIPATEETKGMIDADAIAQMKDHVVLLNFARDLLVDEDAMVRALKEEKVHRYVTDFPTPKISGVEGAIVIPHLGASTEESEDNCARMAVRQTMDYLENGNIKHSVNYPDCELGKFRSGTRITILHHNIPNMIGQFTAVLAKENLNISVMANKSKGQYAYTMMDVEDTVPHTMEAALNAIDGVLKVRMLVKS